HPSDVGIRTYATPDPSRRPAAATLRMPDATPVQACQRRQVVFGSDRCELVGAGLSRIEIASAELDLHVGRRQAGSVQAVARLAEPGSDARGRGVEVPLSQ